MSLAGPRALRFWGSAAVALAVALAPIQPVSAHPSPLAMVAKKKPKKRKRSKGPSDPRLTPAQAEPKRQAILDSVAEARKSGDLVAVAEGLESNGALLGDPVTLLAAAEVRLELAKQQRKVEPAQLAIEDGRVALDILYLLADVAADRATSSWHAIEPGEAGEWIDQAEEQIAAAESFIAELEAERAPPKAAVAQVDRDKKERRKRGPAKPGTGMIAGGAVATVAGAGGLAMVIAGATISAAKQKEVENLVSTDPRVAELDEAGKRANLVTYIGIGVAAAGLLVGLPLVIVGSKKRKQAKESAFHRQLRLAGVAAAGYGGVSLQGRF